MGQRFRGRVALVTGSTQGVGEALLRTMVDEGLVGALVTGRNAARGAQVVSALEAKACDAVFVRADLADPESVGALLTAADDRFGRIDHLANCARCTEAGDVWNTTPELLDRVMAVNVRAPFQLTQGTAELARRNGAPASVVNVAINSALGHPSADPLQETASGALRSMTKALASQLLDSRVRVVAIGSAFDAPPVELAALLAVTLSDSG